VGLALITSMGSKAMKFSEVMIEKDIQTLLSTSGNTLPDPQTLVRTAFIAPEKTGEVRDLLLRYGYSDENIDKLFISNYRLEDPETIKTAWFRGILDDDGLFSRMRELGYTDSRTREITQTWQQIPGAQDLFWLVGKEAFEPETYELLGLNDEYPEEQTKWLKQQGISEAWAHKYWIAHWDQPSIGQGFEMLHRDQIDLNELNILFKTVEIPPYWRDKLTNIAYNPYTRVDVRRMAKLGVLSDEETFDAYRHLGYDDEHALGMLKFTIQYNQGTDKELTKGEILKGYRTKAMSFDDAKTFLMSLDYSEDHTEYLLGFEDYLETQEIEDLRLKNLQTKFEGNLISLLTLQNEMGKLNLPAAKIEALIAKWEINKVEDVKMASKSDLFKFLKYKIINMDTYKLEMQRLGYSWNLVDWYAQLSETEIRVKPAPVDTDD